VAEGLEGEHEGGNSASCGRSGTATRKQVCVCVTIHFVCVCDWECICNFVCVYRLCTSYLCEDTALHDLT
jgi:hypothetical protein